MATEVKIPALGESISSGILAKWHVKSGDLVKVGQSLFDLETDKITSEATADCAGKVECLVAEGDEVEVGAVVARIDESAQNPATEATADDPSADDATATGKTAVTEQAIAPSQLQHPPSVRRLAAESGLKPDSVTGSGKSGRVTKADMQKAIAGQSDPAKHAHPAAGSTQPAAAASATATADRDRKRMSPLRRTIAQRLVQAQQTTAMLTTFNEVDMSAVIACRKQHQEAFTAKHGVKLGFMSFFTKAAVQALKHNPGLNAQIEGEDIITFRNSHIGIAVSTPKGLMVPVLRDCGDKSFATIEKDILQYANKARDGKITLDDLQGGTFTITNGGIFGSMLSTPILNTPQSAILGMHTIQDRAVVVGGQIVVRPMMYLALSYDHRLVDGREAVTFLVDVKKSIEDPSRLLLEI